MVQIFTLQSYHRYCEWMYYQSQYPLFNSEFVLITQPFFFPNILHTRHQVTKIYLLCYFEL